MTRRRRKRRVQDDDFGPDLNRVVTPMLDMSFQLLFLFIVQFRPMIEEGQVDLSLPAQEASSTSAVFQPELDNEKPDEYTFHINSTVPKGSEKPVVLDYSDVRVIRFSSKIEMTEFDPNRDLFDQMDAKLKSLPKYEEGKDKKKPPTIKLQINNKLTYEAVIDLLDRCRRYGKDKNIKDVGLMGYPKDKGGPAPMP